MTTEQRPATIDELVEELAVQTVSAGLSGPPLLQQLREAIGGGTSKNAAGAGEQWRIPLNAAASATWDRISAEIGAMFSGSTDLRSSPVPQVNLLAWAAAFSAAAARGEFVDSAGKPNRAEYETNAIATLQGWADSIRALLDPPRTKHLVVPCPWCGAQRIQIGEGDAAIVTDAIVLEYRAGVDLIAYCRNPGCDGLWVGDAEVIQLGRAAEVGLDVDAIREARAVQPDVVEEDREEPFDPEKPEHSRLASERYLADHRAEISERVNGARVAAGMTQAALAAIAEIRPEAMSRALNGRRRFSLFELRLIADALELRLAWLIGGDLAPAKPGDTPT